MIVELNAKEEENLSSDEVALGYWVEGKKFVYVVQCSEDDLLEEIEAMAIISTKK